MSDKRMFSKQIIESDAFLEIPASSQMLYVHLCMNADDDGVIASPRKVMRMTGATDTDAQILLQKRFLLAVGGLLIVKHWRINNYIRTDRYKPTEYADELETLRIKENGSYTLDPSIGRPLVYQTDTNWEHREEKIRLDKKREKKRSPEGKQYDDTGNPALDRERLAGLLKKREENTCKN